MSMRASSTCTTLEAMRLAHLCIGILSWVAPYRRHAADPLLDQRIQPAQHHLPQLRLILRLVQPLIVQVLQSKRGRGGGSQGQA